MLPPNAPVQKDTLSDIGLGDFYTGSGPSDIGSRRFRVLKQTL